METYWVYNLLAIAFFIDYTPVGNIAQRGDNSRPITRMNFKFNLNKNSYARKMFKTKFLNN